MNPDLTRVDRVFEDVPEAKGLGDIQEWTRSEVNGLTFRIAFGVLYSGRYFFSIRSFIGNRVLATTVEYFRGYAPAEKRLNEVADGLSRWSRAEIVS